MYTLCNQIFNNLCPIQQLISSILAREKNTYCTLLVATPPMMPLMTLLPIPTISSTISCMLESGGGASPPKCQVIEIVTKIIENRLHNYYLTNSNACYYIFQELILSLSILAVICDIITYEAEHFITVYHYKKLHMNVDATRIHTCAYL